MQYNINSILSTYIVTYSGSKVFMPRGPSNFFSATCKAFHAFSVVKSSGAYVKNKYTNVKAMSKTNTQNF